MSIHNFSSDGNADPRDDGDLGEAECRRDAAMNWCRQHKPALLRRIQRAFLQAVLSNGPSTSDVVRGAVPIPKGVDPRVVGSAIRGLAEQKLIVSIGRRKSHRPMAHARKLDLWAIHDAAKVRHWLATHPEIDPPADPTCSVAV